MGRVELPRPSDHIVPVVDLAVGERLWCEACDTDRFLIIEAVRHRHFTPAGYLEVTYFCSKCDGFAMRVVEEAAIKTEFLAAIAVGKLRHGHAVADIDESV